MKRRRTRRRNVPTGRRQQRRAGYGGQRPRCGPQPEQRERGVQEASEPYRPRDVLAPADLLDWLDRHALRATESQAYQDRYLKMLKFFRQCAMMVGSLVVICCLFLGAGIAGAIMVAGMPPWTAFTIGATGTAIGIVALLGKARSYLTKIFGLRLGRPATAGGQGQPDGPRTAA